MHFLPDISHLPFWLPFLIGLWSNSGGNSSNPQTTTNTLTSSGANAPPIIGGGTSSSTAAVSSGSIAVTGNGAKYLESGATDQAGAQVGGLALTSSNLNLSGGGTLTIGDPNASNALAQIAEQLATGGAGGGGSGGGGSVIVPGGGGTSIIPSALQNINWSLIAIVAAAILGVWILFGRRKRT